MGTYDFKGSRKALKYNYAVVAQRQAKVFEFNLDKKALIQYNRIIKETWLIIMIKDIITSTMGDGDSSSVIRFDLSDQSCVNTPLGQLFIDKAGLSRGRMEFNEAFLEIYDRFIHSEILEYFGLGDWDGVRGMAIERHFEIFVEGAGTFQSIKDCKRGLELHEMCDGFKRKLVNNAGLDRSGYFDAHDNLSSEDDYVQEELKKRINELHRQRIKEKKKKCAMV